ncbi:hypothetical protein IAE23_24985 [Bacillus sp. S35]|uniref:hypothetical protein n=1 Tax=Priestia aryabhattai TaxID=412384 RepID=UPI0019094F57|nr:hypothetical protein [Priestia aryabhattai]MBK0009730.1 hypothetical protein [Bacillus sp. S35]MCM3644460.1 hypothetical protein [Priestia aryabhattai]
MGSYQTGGGFSKQKKTGRDPNLSQDIFPYYLTISHTFDSGMPIRSIGISLSNTSIQEEEQMGLYLPNPGKENRTVSRINPQSSSRNILYFVFYNIP